MQDPQGTELVLVLFLFATVLLRLLLVAIVVWLVFPRRRTCPQCIEATVPIRESTYLRFLLLERRWCLSCGWNGIARKSREPGTGGRTAPSIPAAAVVLAIASWAMGCAKQPDRVAELFSSSTQWIDLSHSFDEKTIYWP